MTKPWLLDLFSGEGGAAAGYVKAGFNVRGVDNSRARLRHYPYESIRADALDYLYEHGHEYNAVHASCPCWGYTRGTAAIPDRLTRYDRLIGVTRALLIGNGRPWVIENVEDARSELRNPVRLCGAEFGLTTTDTDGTKLHLRRHRLFETSFPLMGAGGCPGHPRGQQVAGSYGGARRDKDDARNIRKGGYVPSADVQRALLQVPWMSEVGCRLSLPPVYTEHVGWQLIAHLNAARAVA